MDGRGQRPKTEIMRLWKAKRWKELREALGAKAMIAGAAMVQIGHDPKTAKQKQKEKETAISTERHKARQRPAVFESAVYAVRLANLRRDGRSRLPHGGRIRPR